MAERNLIQLERLLSRVSDNYYRLSDYTIDGRYDTFSPELVDAIDELGAAIDVVSSLIDEERLKNTAEKVMTINV